MLEPAGDAADLVSLFRGELDLIARWAGVQPEALYRYVADRATSDLPGGTHSYSFDDEPAVREEMRCLGLEVTYRRPVPRRVEKAMDEAVAMLVDHGRLHHRYFSALDSLFTSEDPHFVIARPTPRPPIVAPIRERSESEYVGSDWTAGAIAADAVIGRTMPASAVVPGVVHAQAPADQQRVDETDDRKPSDGCSDGAWLVVAEETWLRWLDWKFPTETRVGVRLERKMWASIDPQRDQGGRSVPDDVDGDTAAGEALDAHLARFSNLTADEYLTHARAPFSMVVRNLAYRFDTPGGGWLAFNPALAEHLGWQPAPDGLFRWLDRDGSVAAESVWWQDGFAQHRPPKHDDEVGQGWIVRVSASGWRQIATAVGECVDWRQVARLALEQPPQRVADTVPASDSPTKR
jgi:hypothetical protein